MGTITYLLLNASVLVVTTAALWRYIERDRRTWRIIALHMLPLTIIFDSLCIAVGIFGYNPATISGIKLGPMPVEDLFYTVVAIVIVPALWKLFERKKEETNAR